MFSSNVCFLSVLIKIFLGKNILFIYKFQSHQNPLIMNNDIKLQYCGAWRYVDAAWYYIHVDPGGKRITSMIHYQWGNGTYETHAYTCIAIYSKNYTWYYSQRHLFQSVPEIAGWCWNHYLHCYYYSKLSHGGRHACNALFFLSLTYEYVLVSVKNDYMNFHEPEGWI